jgi:hypothetical protein
MSPPTSQPSPSIGQRLLAALTHDQVETLLTAVAEAGLLARWKTEFKRRRNLWAEMATVHCPGL